MDFDGLRALVVVVETGSINQAASKLDWPRSTLTRRLAALEATFGSPLLVTSRDGALPTEAGKRLADGAKELLNQAAELEASLRLGLGNPGRPIHVWISPGFQPELLALGMAHMRRRAPELRFCLSVRADPFASSPHDHPDFIVCFERPRAGPFVIFQATALPFALKASPEYFERHGRPDSMEALLDHELWAWGDCLEETTKGRAIALTNGGHQVLSPMVVTNDLHQLHIMVQSGCCIGLVPSGPFDAWEPNEVELFPGQLSGKTGLWVAVPEVSAAAPWMRMLMEEIRAIFVHFAEMNEGEGAAMSWEPISTGH